MEQKVKTKVRFTSLDIAAMVAELKGKLLGCRLTNIYDLSPSTYLFKMSRGDDKHYLLCENGMRFHTTEAKAEKNKMPSGFTMKFRKFLRSKRLEAIRQVGMERVVVLTFGQEQFSNHLILELYSQGNIILTDQNYRILQCMRSHQFTDKIKTAVGELYPFEYAANIYLEKIDVSRARIEAVMKEIEASANQEEPKPEQTAEQDKGKKGKKKKQQKKTPSIKLKDMIFKLIPCLFPQVIDHILSKGNYPSNEKCTPENIDMTAKAAEEALNFTKRFQSEVHPGYLLINLSKQKQAPPGDKSEEPKAEDQKEKYIDYAPYLHVAYENKPHRTLPSFSQAVDTYYQVFKKPQEGDELEQLAWRKYEQIKKDQEARVGKLRTQQQESQLRAELIEKNIDDVDAVIRIFKTMLDQGYSWGQVDKMLHESKKQGDPLANLVHVTHLQRGSVQVLLGDPTEDQLSDLTPVEVKLDYNAYTNAKNYYESRKKNYQKQVRTKEASEQVLKIAEKEAVKDLEKRKNQRQGNAVSTRKPYWFQKFYWFISSQNYLVISGRDSHQNEIIVKKYMRAGDLYMHSDYGGAASTVVKNPSKEPVPRLSLEQAAIFTVCRSKAWDTKIISGAWWVYNDQVSKSAPTGEFLPTGSFMIRGKKNFVYPNKMEMGITLMYRIGQDCVARHLKDQAELGEIAKLDSQKSEIEVAHEQKLNNEQFSIINLEQAPKKTQQQQKGKGDKKEQPKPTKKEDIKKSDDSDEQEQQSEEQEEKDATNDKQKKQPAKQQKKKQSDEPKKAYVNKKKLKKLEKYMEEQDEQQREVIMKMLGAKQMKHMREPEESEDEAKKGKKEKEKEKEKNRKEKKNKFHIADEDEVTVIDKEKVLFLKEQPKQENKYVKSKQVDKKQTTEPTQTEKIESVEKQHFDVEKKPETQPKEPIAPVNVGEEVSEQKPAQGQAESSSGSDGEEQKQEKKEDLNYEEDEKVLDSDINELNRLVGKVYPEDNYDCLITMCAPYPTITENHFKIKLTPGGLKKGKAARNILHYFSTVELSEREKPLIKTFPEQEIINALLGNVKLGAAGMLKLQLKEKAEKKQKRKQKDKQKAADKK